MLQMLQDLQIVRDTEHHQLEPAVMTEYLTTVLAKEAQVHVQWPAHQSCAATNRLVLILCNVRFDSRLPLNHFLPAWEHTSMSPEAVAAHKENQDARYRFTKVNLELELASRETYWDDEVPDEDIQSELAELRDDLEMLLGIDLVYLGGPVVVDHVQHMAACSH